MTATRMGLHSGRPESPPARLTVMAVGISTTSTGEEDGSITPLVVGDGLVDDERAGWEPVLVVGARKAPRSRTIKMPRPARAVTAIEPIRPAVVEIRGSRRPRPLGATEERYAAKRESEPLSVSQCGRGEARCLVIACRRTRRTHFRGGSRATVPIMSTAAYRSRRFGRDTGDQGCRPRRRP